MNEREVQNQTIYNGYKYTINIPLNQTEILKRLQEEDIFSFWLSKPVDTNEKYHAPYRNDRNPGCYFWYGRKKLFFVDFANSHKSHLDCFDLGMMMYNISFTECLKIINSHFELGLGGGTTEVKKVINQKSSNESNKLKCKIPTKIDGRIRNYTCRDGEFWSPYGITAKQLLEDKVYPLEFFISNRPDGSEYIIYTKQSYAFTEFNPSVKIYSPLNKKYKWITNCNNSHIGNDKVLKQAEFETSYLVITKSYKDCRVLRNIRFNSIWVQNEKVVLPEEIISQLKSKYTNILTFFDNDDTGIALTDKYKKLYDLNGLRIPKNLKDKGITDASDFVKVYGYDNLKKLIFWEIYYFKTGIVLPKGSLDIINGRVQIKEKKTLLVNQIDAHNLFKKPFNIKPCKVVITDRQVENIEEEWYLKFNRKT